MSEIKLFTRLYECVEKLIDCQGPCDDVEDEQDNHCKDPDCTYCNLVKAHQEIYARRTKG